MAKRRDKDQEGPRTVHTGGGAYIGGDVHVGGDFAGRDWWGAGSPPPIDLDGAEAEAARGRYLAALRRRYGVIQTHAFMELAQDERVGSPKRLRLLGERGAYVPLFFDVPAVRRTQTEVSPDGEDALVEDSAKPIERVLGLIPGHLAIIGDAGSGKTTVLHVIISALAAEDPEDAFGARFKVLDGQRPLPIFLPLRLFEYACCDEASGYERCAQDLLRFVDDWFARWCPEADLPPRFLEAHLRAGRAWFLLDALDEVAAATHRQTVRSVIQDLAGHGNGPRLIVTARVAAYRSTRLDDRFTVVTVRDLNEEQRDQMVRVIYTGLELENAGRQAQDLIDRFACSVALRDLV